MNKVNFTTTSYQVAHRKSPSGRGHWAFCPANKFRSADYLSHTFFAAGLKTYSDAKKEAAAHFAAKGEFLITVCP